MLAVLIALTSGAAAGDWKDREIEPKVLTDVTAFTVGQGRVRLGLFEQEVGLLDNLSLGVTTLLFLPPISTPNIQGKVTAVQTRYFDASLDGGVYYRDLQDIVGTKSSLLITPVGWTGSITPHRRWGFHFGQAWTFARLEGEISAKQIGQALGQVLGSDVSEDLLNAKGVGTGAYAGANLSLVRLRFAADYRLNRRDSIVFISNNYLLLTGLLAAGATTQTAAGEAQVGASARISIPLRDSLATATSLSWQWSWERFHLRLGVPLPLANFTAWPQAVNLFWVLGKRSEPELPDASEDEPTEDP